MVLKVVFISLLCSLFHYGQTQIGMGPLNVKLVRFSDCPADENYLTTADVVARDDGFDGVTFELNTPIPLDETLSYVARVDKIQNGQVQKGIFKNSGNDVCRSLNKFLGKLWGKLRSEMGMGDCPVPAGSYKVENFKVDPADSGLKTFLYGRFLWYFELVKDGKKIFCRCLEFTNSRPGESV